mmetsp:Transcript_17734/g.30539  ORF Transcript_17734/g.30539 Transcript_17734/m.30539 type:complete len:246 (-) Transcript_17734:475-1212(-)
MDEPLVALRCARDGRVHAVVVQHRGPPLSKTGHPQQEVPALPYKGRALNVVSCDVLLHLQLLEPQQEVQALEVIGGLTDEKCDLNVAMEDGVRDLVWNTVRLKRLEAGQVGRARRRRPGLIVSRSVGDGEVVALVALVLLRRLEQVVIESWRNGDVQEAGDSEALKLEHQEDFGVAHLCTRRLDRDVVHRVGRNHGWIPCGDRRDVVEGKPIGARDDHKISNTPLHVALIPDANNDRCGVLGHIS